MSEKQRILILGVNHASTMNSLVRALKDENVNAKGLSFDIHRSKYNDYSCVKCIYAEQGKMPKWLFALFYRLQFFLGLFIYLFYLLRANVIIYYSHPTYNLFRRKPSERSLELLLIKIFVPKRFVWFTGSDIRDGIKELTINPYFHYAWDNPDYEYKICETKENSEKLQRKFARYGFKAIVWDQFPFINQEIFNEYSIIPHCSYSTINNKPCEKSEIKIVHAPTAPIAKGSSFIIDVMKKICEKYKFVDFTILQNISNKEYVKQLNEADVLIDQVIWGAYGVASQQALEAGKVVIAYLHPKRVEMIYGRECPVVNTTIDDMYFCIEELICNIKNLENIGMKSRIYFDKLHKPSVVANRLLTVISKN